MTEQAPLRRVTAPSLRAMKERGERIVVATAYDVCFARLFEDAGVDALLVGDSLGMVVQGAASTLPVRLEDVIYHCRAVVRGVRRAHVVADLPFMTYQVAIEQALRSAGRLLQEGGAHAVKLEGGVAMAPTVQRLVEVGIPVMGHVGLLPQSVHAMGGYGLQGRGAHGERVLKDARALQDAGAYAVVLEKVPSELAATVREQLQIPVIGIGAGASCDGQVLVGHDLLGLTTDLRPRFVKRYEELYARGVDAAKRYCEEVRGGAFPGREHSFGDGGEA